MHKLKQVAAGVVIGGLLFGDPLASSAAAKRKSSANAPEEALGPGEKVLWQEPVDIRDRDLIHGQGGTEHQPAGNVFEFTKEDLSASNPKFTVHDDSGVKWKVKLGDEARPETVATRLVWAVGFQTDEDYVLPQVRVTGMPKLHRGANLVGPDGTMQNARFERDIPGEQKVGEWKWADDPFTGTREWNGLRVMMALINNWDLKDVNNSIYEVGKKDNKRFVYVVSDLGASFGPTKLDLGRKTDKGELAKYRRTAFIRKTRPESVDFTVPGAPSPIFAFNPVVYFRRRHLQWIGRDIPREDARWMGTVLARLSAAQIRDAFRAGGYSPEEVEAFADIVQRRIASLTDL